MTDYEPDDLTVTEAAKRLGLARSTVLWQIRNGVIRARRVGPIFVIATEEIERYRLEHLGKPGVKVRTDDPRLRSGCSASSRRPSGRWPRSSG